MLSVVIMLVAAAVPPTQVPAAQARSAAAEPLTPEVRAWIEQLSSPLFTQRQQATEQLCDLEQSRLPSIYAAYVAAEDYEVKRRLRYVAEHIIYREQIEGRRGFLGIQVNQRVETIPVDGTGKTLRGVIIERVIPGFSAESSGLIDKDIVVSVNGRELPDDPTPATFITQISAMKPGSELSIRVLRTQGVPRALDVPLGDEPGKALEGASFEVTPGGLRIEGVLPGSPAEKAGLRAKDQIASLNGRPLGGGTGLLVLNNILQTAAPGDHLTIELRDVRDVTVPVKLGARPVEMLPPQDVPEAQAKFMQWWQEQGGELNPPITPTRPRVMVFGMAQQMNAKPPDPEEARLIP